MMKNKFFLLILIVLTACSAAPEIQENPPNQQDSISLPSTNTPLVQTPTLPPTATIPLTATSPNQVMVMTNEEPDLVATSLNFQIDEYELTLTAAANQIETLQSQRSTLIPAATSASSSSSSSSSGYVIPSNVYTVTIIDDAFLEITKMNNNKDAPIMEQVQPQIRLDPGFQTWVYKSHIAADGGGRYYEVYDPDGQSAARYYLRAIDIQIRMSYGSPPPATYPMDVVKVKATSNVIAYYAIGLDSKGKPIMEAFQPRLTYGIGDTIFVHASRVLATGNMRFLALYDPDGKSSLYIVASKVEFLKIWD
ncbi:MAG: hypothetical protein ABFS17_11155 [Chloroflexota bacterium]